MKDYRNMTTDQLLEELPHHLMVARNDNAPASDRWRIHNHHLRMFIEPGYATPRELLIATLERIQLSLSLLKGDTFFSEPFQTEAGTPPT